MKRSYVYIAAGSVAMAISAAAARQAMAQTLLYSYETIAPSGLTPPDDGMGPDGFVAIGGTVTQDTFGATVGTHSMKFAMPLDDFFDGARTAVGLPFDTINAATTTAIRFDMTVKAGDEFVGGFASLGITEFGTYQDPDFGTLSGQAQTLSAAEQNVRLAAGTYHFVIPLIARNNPNINSGRPNCSFNGVFVSDPFGTMTPTAFQFYVNKGGTTGNPSVPNAPFAAYFDNVQAISNPVSSWRAAVDSNWSTGTNWYGLPTVPINSPGNTSQSPNGIDAIAQFGLGQISGNITVTVDSPKTVGTLYFNHGSSYAIAGTSTLTLDVTSGQSNVYTYGGSHTISAPLLLNDNTTFTVAGGNASLTVSGNMTATGKTITKDGAGPVQFENVRAAGLNVSAGSVKMSLKPTPNSPSGTSVVNSLTIANGAVLDLTDNSAVIDYTGAVGTLVNDVRQHLQAGRLTSSASDASHRIGYGNNAILNKTNFAGQTVDSSSILIKFTYGGDANLDGQVDVTDLGALATNWQTSSPWTGGDFNYDGLVDVTDLGALATNWQAGVGSPLGRDSLQAALASVGLGGVSVPEPLGIASAALLGVATLARRTRRQPQLRKNGNMSDRSLL